MNQEWSNNWYFDSSYSIHFLNQSIVSVIENNFTFTGGAHGSAGINGLNFYISPNYKFDFKDLFRYEDSQIVLEFISEYCFQELRTLYNEWMQTSEEEIKIQNKSMFWENSLDPDWEKFDNFLISNENISFIFNQYQVSSYAFGMHIIDIPFQEFFKLNIELTVLSTLKEKLK